VRGHCCTIVDVNTCGVAEFRMQQNWNVQKQKERWLGIIRRKQNIKDRQFKTAVSCMKAHHLRAVETLLVWLEQQMLQFMWRSWSGLCEQDASQKKLSTCETLTLSQPYAQVWEQTATVSSLEHNALCHQTVPRRSLKETGLCSKQCCCFSVSCMIQICNHPQRSSAKR